MLLDQINSPADLKQLASDQLPQLAEEIRQFLISNLAATGGHLAPNLGVVELTLALHYLFDSPKDKFLWDVGHQAYVHKILTGRKHLFPSLRQYKGLCGFPKRSESEHDVWETGHSSTSLSAAMGMAAARDLQGAANHVIAIIGDGALTGGMALEALNHIGYERKKVMVILNDNEMSISPNVGAIHRYMGDIRKGKRNSAELAAGMERLGFTYIGPVDGHDLTQLLDSLKGAAQIDGPVLFHVLTTKGKGYEPAERNAVKWHGIGSYQAETGCEVKAKNTAPSYASVFAQTMIKLAAEEPKLVAVTPAMSSGSGLDAFGEVYAERLFDVGIAEQHACTFAAGLAIEGMKPVLAIYSTFLQRAYDQVIHDVARQKLPVMFAIDRAGFVGADGETHQGAYDIAFMRTVPNMVIMAPKDENELQHMMKTAVNYEEGPIAFRYPRGQGRGVPMDETLQPLPIGRAEVIHPGKELAILSFGHVFEIAEQAAEMLRQAGHEPMLVNARFCKPLDEALLTSLAEQQYTIITVEEGAVQGGFGSAVMEFYAQAGYHEMQVHAFGIPDYFVEHGSVQQQRAEVGLTAEEIVARALSLQALQQKAGWR